MVSYDTRELRALAGSFRASSLLMYSQAEERLAVGGYQIEARAKANIQANGSVQTGAMLNSVSTSTEGLTVEVGPTVEYGGYVEQGTDGPYPIPNAFGWGITVMHPGNAPKPYLGPAFDAEIDGVVDSFLDLGDL
ncbi:MAG: Bacteriophage HK97-gp10, putative tail-component [Marmoricola sp.]|nr:Bacteriophage HK97-gp10, putative tail-component [Marmoricola sp.]